MVCGNCGKRIPEGRKWCSEECRRKGQDARRKEERKDRRLQEERRKAEGERIRQEARKGAASGRSQCDRCPHRGMDLLCAMCRGV